MKCDALGFWGVFIMFIMFGLIITAIRRTNQDPNDVFQKGVHKVTYEGHEYLMYDRGTCRGICHYPECKCLKDK